MNHVELWDAIGVWAFRVAILMVGLIIVERIRAFWIHRPCWFFGHDQEHISIRSDRRWNDHGDCGRLEHRTHRGYKDGKENLWPCYITKWVCRRCPDMGFRCIGDVYEGAWKIEYGRVVPDSKKWAEFRTTEYPKK